MKSQLEDFAEKEGLSVEDMEIRDDAKVVDSTISTITAALKALCIIISILTMLIVIFVEALVVRAKIIRDWKGMGISKALGQTSGGLILQIMISNIPAIVIGLLVGVIISQPVGAKLCLLVFSFFGMKSINFNLPPIWVSGTAIAILAVAIITSGLLGLKVHGLKPVDMITEE